MKLPHKYFFIDLSSNLVNPKNEYIVSWKVQLEGKEYGSYIEFPDLTYKYQALRALALVKKQFYKQIKEPCL